MMLTLALIGFILGVFSQFGGKLSAKSSLTWWFIFIFLLLTTIAPESFRPIANFFGIQLVSNMVMAGLIVLHMFLILQESAHSASVQRKLRDSISSQAANEFTARFLFSSVGQETDVQPQSEKTARKTKVLVVFPTYNEEESLSAVIQEAKIFQFSWTLNFIFCLLTMVRVTVQSRF